MAELTDTDIREQVRDRYAGHAKLAIEDSPRAARQAEEACCGTTGQSAQFGDVLYDDESSEGATESAVAASLGCGVPTAFLKGYIEELPLPDGSVDIVISNCVINLSADKHRVIREAARVLRPGGRFAVSDVIADPDMDLATRRDMKQWTGCIAGALTRFEFAVALHNAGLDDVEITETHRVHEHAGSAIIRARKPL